jgi:citrate synthase
MSTKKYELTNLDSGKKSTLQALGGTLGPDCLNISSLLKDQGVFTFDPGFMSTASCESRITYIDGDEGVLLYRGYPIEECCSTAATRSTSSRPSRASSRWRTC